MLDLDGTCPGPLEGLAPHVARPLATLPLVALEELIPGVEVAPWFRGAVTPYLESPMAFDRVIGLGLVARHGAAAAQDAGGMIAAYHAGEPGPATRAIAWARRYADAEMAVRLDEDGLTEAMAVDDLFDALRDANMAEGAAAGDPEPAGAILGQAAGAIARYLRRERELLAAVALVLSRLDAGAALRDALWRLDARASDEATTLALAADADVPDDDLLVSVACGDPDAWWGA